MFIPYGTDTAIYHWPISTVALIVINVICFPLLDQEMFALSHGEGLHPLQWVTSFFMHAGIFHLVGNMLFLWVFGVVVEGKVGSFVFAALYLSVGIFQNFVEQLLYLGVAEMPSLGASSAIYGMMMVSMLFAPKDNLLCFIIVFYRPYFFSVPILIFAIFYFMWDFSFAMFDGFSMGTALLHVMGGVVGLLVGVVMLRFDWVDCDDEDLFALFRDAFGKKKKKKKLSKREKSKRKDEHEQAELSRQRAIAVAWKSIDTHYAAGNVDAALAVYTKLHRREPNERWSETRLLKIIKHFMEAKDWNRVVEYSEEYLKYFHSRETAIRINLAKIYVVEKEFPRQALKVLAPIDRSSLSEQQSQVCQQIVLKAKALISEGTLEFGDE